MNNLQLVEQYHRDTKDSTDLMDALRTFRSDDVESLLRLLKSHRVGQVLVSIVETAVKTKKKPTATVKSRGKACLTSVR